ncbi:unnamed protein product [Adineta steineri]|uniref:Uncharacterized protein n=1 Tax=Adineta steineri TaxID=433720 RepID=A0A816E5P0_9BILA|nr:unnamed protein product [Adineta steineri]CAF1643340.1 unnamed protein product [Adineta steineri]
MPGSLATQHKTSNTDKTHSDKNKHVSTHTGTKNTTHGHTIVNKKSDVVEHMNVHNKTNPKRRNSIDTHTKTTHAAGGTHAHEATRSRGATVSHGSHPHTKAQTHIDTHGKSTTLHAHPNVHRKTVTHGTTKKSDGHKSRIIKYSKSENNSSDQEKFTSTGTVTFDTTYLLYILFFLIETETIIKTAVSETPENITSEKPDDDETN